MAAQLVGEREQEAFGVVGERAVDLGGRLGFVAVKQPPVLSGQQLAEVLAPVLADDPGLLEGKLA